MLACKINVNKSIETKKGKKPIKWKREHRRRGEQIQRDKRKEVKRQPLLGKDPLEIVTF